MEKKLKERELCRLSLIAELNKSRKSWMNKVTEWLPMCSIILSATLMCSKKGGRPDLRETDAFSCLFFLL